LTVDELGRQVLVPFLATTHTHTHTHTHTVGRNNYQPR